MASVIWPIWLLICWACLIRAARLAIPLNIVCILFPIWRFHMSGGCPEQLRCPLDHGMPGNFEHQLMLGCSFNGLCNAVAAHFVFFDDEFHVNSPSGSIDQCLFESGNLFWAFTKRLSHSIHWFETYDQTVWRGNC